MLALASTTGCLYWVPVPYAQNASPELASDPQPSTDAPVALGTHAQAFTVAVSDTDTVSFLWTLDRDGHQSPVAQGVDGKIQWQQISIQGDSDFGTQTLSLVVTDGVSDPYTCEWIVVGS